MASAKFWPGRFPEAGWFSGSLRVQGMVIFSREIDGNRPPGLKIVPPGQYEKKIRHIVTNFQEWLYCE